ncbi:nephrocystin-4 isoform X2 [Arapaima gigas]
MCISQMDPGGPVDVTVSEWRKVFEQCRAVPPHIQTVRLGVELPSQGFHLGLKRLVGLEQRALQGSQGVRYQLRVSLFDINHRHFFGRTWKGTPQPMRSNTGEPSTVPFNEVLYFHTSLRIPNVVAVVEVVSLEDKSDGSHPALGCGIAILHLFPRKGDPVETPDSQPQRRVSVYQGTPRALLHPALRDPMEQSGLLTPLEGVYLHYSLQPHPPLQLVMALLPQNTLVSGSEPIPGVVPSSDITADALRKPRLLKSFTCHLDKLSVVLHPSLEKFEEQLLQLLNADRLSQRNWGPDGGTLAVQERRLHVGVHNGWGFLERPQVVVLEPESEGPKSRIGGVRPSSGNRLSSQTQVLALRSCLQLHGMVHHPAFAVVFQLEYVFSAPIGGDGKPCPTSSSRMAFMQCMRWASWCPFQEPSGNPEDSDVCVALLGGAGPNPEGVMVYAVSPLSQSSTEVKDAEGGSVKFRFSTHSDGQPPASFVQSRAEDLSRLKKPPSPARGRRDPATPRRSPPDSPQGPGLSISQLAVTPRYPTISHSVASPWQQQFPAQLYPCPATTAYRLSHAEIPCASGIAHLEVGLNRTPTQAAMLDEEPLQELPFTPVHAPIIAMGTQTSGSPTFMSRSSMAHLYSAGFPDILDYDGQVAEVLDPKEAVNFNPQKEEVDVLRCNKLILQFLAFSRIPQEGMDMDWPKTVYFTFQVYRFPPVRTQRLSLLSADGAAGDKYPCILAIVGADGTIDSGSPGLELDYLVDPDFLKPGELRWFLRYLALHTLQIDVWDGDSLLLVGSAAVELKHLLRQGRPAVQVTQDLEVITTEYFQDGDGGASTALAPISVFTTVKGTLHLRLGNVGLPFNTGASRSKSLPASRSHVLVTHDGTRGFSGGSLSAQTVPGRNVRKVCHAQRLVDVDANLASLLRSTASPGHARPGTEMEAESEEARRRKLARMEAVRRYEEQGHAEPPPRIASRQEERLKYTRVLGLIEAYRERSKVESITRMLSLAITTRHTIYAALGTAEFFEFPLKNPFNVQQTVTIECEDPELSVIVDSAEWRHFKDLTQSSTPLEEYMFHLKESSAAPQVYLRPKETVYVPLKYQTFTSQHALQEPSSILTGASGRLAEKQQLNTVQPKTIKVVFRAEDRKPMAICQVDVEPTPHVVDQTFRFYHPELTFLKKAIRLPLWDSVPGSTVGGGGRELRVRVRCSDPNVICDTSSMAPGEPQDVFLKVTGSQSPQIKKFFVLVFTDEWLAVPAQIWQVYVHFLQRVDISCVTGQLTWQSLVLRGTQAHRKVKCHTSHPGEIQVDPAEVFALPPNAVQDLRIGVCPSRAGAKFAYLNVVDVDRHQLVASWLLCVSCRQPLISKAFEIVLPTGGGKCSNKKITYTNPYRDTRGFLLRTDHPELLHFKEDSFQVGGGETHNIGLRFAPTRNPGTEEILVFINNQENKNEETFCIKVRYR